MNVLRSQAEPELTHVLLTNKDAEELVAALRKTKNKTGAILRSKLKKVLK